MGRTLTVPGRSVLPSSAAPALNTTTAPLDAFGGSSRGLIQAGQQLGNLGDQMAAEALRIQQDENERVSKNLDIMFGEAIRKIQFGDEQTPGYYSAKGENALTGFDPASEAIDKAMKEVAGSTKNQRALQLFNRSAQVRKLAALNSMSRHREQERIVAAKATSDARILGAVNDAAVNWRDEKAIGISKATIMSEIMDQAEDQGWSPDVANQKLGEALTTMHSEAVMNAFRQDPVEAQIYYTRHLDEIDGAARSKLEKLLEDSVLRVRSQELAQKYISEYDNEADAIAAAEADLKGKLEDEAVGRIVSYFQLKDRELRRETSRINALNAADERKIRLERRDAEAKAPELAADIVAQTDGLSAALAMAREKYDGPMYDEVEKQIRTQVQGARSDVTEARQTSTAAEQAVKRRAEEEAPARAAAIVEEYDSEAGALNEARRLYKGVSYAAVEAQIKSLFAAEGRDKTRDEKTRQEQATLFAVGIVEQNLSEDAALKKVSDLFNGPMYDAVSQQVRQHFAAERRARTDAVKEARRSAFASIAEGGTVEGWRSQNPEQYAVLSEEGGAIKDLYDAYAREVENRIYSPASDGETFETLRSLPEGTLVDTDLVQLRAKLTKDEYEDAVRLQNAAKKSQERDERSTAAYAARDRAITNFKPKIRSGGVLKDAMSLELEQKVRNLGTLYIEQFKDANDGKSPTQSQVEAEMQRLMLPIIANPGGWNSWFTEVEVGDKVFGVNAKDELTEDQIAVARVPIERIPDQMLLQVQKVAEENGVPYTTELAERFAALKAMGMRDEAARLLGVRQ